MVNSPVAITFDMNPEMMNVEAQDYNGTQIAPLTTVTSGNLNLPEPIWPYHRFLGWSDTPAVGGNIITRAAKRKMTLYAQWAEFRPRAKLYVDGIFLKEVQIPRTQSQADGLGDAFVIKNNWVTEMPILEAYLNTANGNRNFFGWYYIDEAGVRVEFRYMNPFTGGGSATWLRYRAGDRETTTVQGSFGTAPVAEKTYFYPKHDIALNAVFNNWTNIQKSDIRATADSTAAQDLTMVKGHIGRIATISYDTGDENLDFSPRAKAEIIAKNGAISDIKKWSFGEDVLLPAYSSRGRYFVKKGTDEEVKKYLVGWKIGLNNSATDGDDSDIFNLPMQSAQAEPIPPEPSFYLHPEYSKFLNNGRIYLTAVTVDYTGSPDANQGFADNVRGGYNKKIDKNGIISLEYAREMVNILLVKDYTTRTAMWKQQITFNARGGQELTDTTGYAVGDYRDVLDVTITGGVFLQSLGNNFRFAPGKINLPVMDKYAVGGKIFAGWRSSFDNNIYPGGMEYNIPRQMQPTENNYNYLSFTAVWVSGRRLVTFDMYGVGNTKDSTGAAIGVKSLRQSNTVNFSPLARWNDGNSPVDESRYYVLPGTTINLPTVSRWGYVFLGWEDKFNTDTEGKTLKYEPGEALRVNSFQREGQYFEHNLVAMWQAKSLSVTEMKTSSGAADNTVYMNLSSEAGVGTLNGAYDVGDIMTVKRHSLEPNMDTWAFRKGDSNPNRPDYSVYSFAASFIPNISVKLDEAFFRAHIGNRNFGAFFQTPIHITGVSQTLGDSR